MTTSAIFLKSPSGICIETDDDVRARLLEADGEDPELYNYIIVRRLRDEAVVLIPIDNIADVIIGGHR